jgi:protein SCO1/2
MSLAVRMWMSLVLVLVGAYGAYSFWRHADAHSAESGAGDAVPAEDIVLAVHQVDAGALADLKFTDSEGKPFTLKQLEGKVWVGSFFFSSCPYTCRQLNTAIMGLQKELKDQDVTFVSFTVDPDNDTPEVLKNYAATFEADPKRWLFVNGPFDDTQKICNQLFQLPIQGKAHSERMALIDRDGKLRGTYYALSAEGIASFKKQLKRVLAGEPEAEDKS